MNKMQQIIQAQKNYQRITGKFPNRLFTSDKSYLHAFKTLNFINRLKRIS